MWKEKEEDLDIGTLSQKSSNNGRDDHHLWMKSEMKQQEKNHQGH